MKIAIIGAMDQEVELLKNSLNSSQTHQVNHLTVYQGELHGHDVFLVKCGIGKVASAIATSILIKEFSPELVINTGSAGGLDKELNIGDIVVGDHLLHHDVDVTHFGYKLGQVPAMPETYECATKFTAKAIEAASELDGAKVKSGLICSGDSFIGSDEVVLELQKKFPEMKAVEMEAAAIGQTCFMMGVDFVVIRSLSDIAGKTSSVSFEQYLETAAVNSAKLVMSTISKI